MNEENLKSLKEDFRDWLSHPLTKTLVDIISYQKDLYLRYGNGLAFSHYHKKGLDDKAVSAYGKVDGIETIIGMINSCKESKETCDSVVDEVFGGKDGE